ncbi:uncharacterized protein LOC134845801 [Symsagittifera roscoffensis]|uniref:uncharacterized protein LOC134845801 n=1 Tax=Symsagittifera roscoffensis TaxID=84072 RepID=UPI00307CC461
MSSFLRGKALSRVLQILLLGCLLKVTSVVADHDHERCSDDWYCLWVQENQDSSVGSMCCNDNYCHDNCAVDVFVFVLFVFILPCLCCAICAGTIALIIYCVNKNGQQAGVVHYQSGGNGTMSVYPQYGTAYPPYPSQAYAQPPALPAYSQTVTMTPQEQPSTVEPEPSASNDTRPQAPPPSFKQQQASYGFVGSE